MINKIILYISIFFTVGLSFGQYSTSEDQYNGFTARNFMKFNSFFTIPTFSVLHRTNQTIEAITRSSNVVFDDAPRLHLLSYSGKMKSKKGAGVAVYQQEVGVFKDFGAIANYAHEIPVANESSLTFGFNFVYSRRGLNDDAVITQDSEETLISNFQDIPIVNFQPALTFTYSDFEIGLFFENLLDFNLKQSELVTSFADKTYTGHLGYAKKIKNTSGLLKDTRVRAFAVVRSAQEFTYGGNLMVDLPKAGWVKGGYDSFYGLNLGLGVNVSEKLSIGFTYETNDNLGNTNEVGLLYKLGKSRRTPRVVYKPTPVLDDPVIGNEEKNDYINSEQKTPIKKKNQKFIENHDYEDHEHGDLSDEVQRAQDSIDSLHKKIDKILEVLKNTPKGEQTKLIIREGNTSTQNEDNSQVNPVVVSDPVRVVENPSGLPEELDTSLERSTATPWRSQSTEKSGGGAGSMYYVALDQFRDLAKTKALVETYKRRKIDVKYVRDPKTGLYYVYEERYYKKEEAEKVKKEINVGGGFENSGNDMQITAERKYQDPVYLVKITFGAAGETYKTEKTQPKATVRTMKWQEGLIPGYYMVVNVFSKKAYAHKFVEELRADGIDANYFINPDTGYRHVYITKSEDKNEIIRLYNNNLDGRYYDRKNLTHIKL